MAANVKSLELKTLEEICKVLLLLRHELTRVYDACQEKRKETECRVEQCRTLVKPWPSSITQETVHKDEQAAATEPEVPLPEDAATAAEQQDLVLLEKLLKKAQKAREVQAKVDEAKDMVVEKKTVYRKPKVNPAAVKESSKRPMPSKASTRQPVLARKPRPKQSTMKTTYSSSFSQKSRPSSSIASSRQPKNNLDSVMKNTERSLQSRKDYGDSRGKSGNRGSSVAETSSVRQKGPDQYEKRDWRPRRQHTPDGSEEAPALRKKSSLDFAGPSDESKEQSGVLAEASREKTFNLLSDGSNLKLPSKYRKLKSQNAKLNLQLRDAVRDGTAKHQRFLECLEMTFDLKTVTTHAKLHEEATQMLELNEKLLRLASIAVTESQGLLTGASPPWQQVYKCYCLWQLALDRFRELQRRTQQLLQEEENLFKSCPCGNCVVAERHRLQTEMRAQQEEKPGTKGAGGCVLLSDWLPPRDKIVDERNVEELTYSSCKDVTELLRLRHTAQLLRHQLDFGRVAADKLLPLLDKLDTADRTFVPSFYRLLFGLLCCEGKVFPALVLDAFAQK